MPRIRSVKPCFFRHDELIDLELSHSDLKPMLVFSALWGHCDKNGVFEWKPRYLQLDILPFYWSESGKQLVASLMLLREKGFIKTVSDGQKVYGFIPTFKDHQRISGKELKEKSVYPEPTELTEFLFEGELGKQRGSNGEATETAGREGKGREGKGIKESKLGEKFEEKRVWLSERFPDVDLEFQKEKLLTKYDGEKVMDPWQLILAWFEALPKKPPARTSRSADDDIWKGVTI